MEGLLYGILLTAVLSLALNIVLKRFDLPVIIGYILAGAVISRLFHLHETHRQHLFEVAEFGIVFLMFTIGLEFPLGQLKRLKREVFVFGSLQVVLSMAVFSLLGILLFDIGQKAALLIGGALALSSTAIVLKMLQESGHPAFSGPLGHPAAAHGIALFP
jgi:CPA2 family monovalent cation:H+ antiporter-2